MLVVHVQIKPTYENDEREILALRLLALAGDLCVL